MLPGSRESASADRVAGVVVGIVSNNKDPDGKYRVKVRFPWLPNGSESGGEESTWCRIAALMAGADRGTFFLPEVGDEVLVAFEQGHFSRPFVVGMLWNGKDKPPYDNKNGKNNVRAITSRSGHVVEFWDDSDNSKENITIKTKAGHRVVIDDSNKKIEIYDKDGKNFILIDSGNSKVQITSDGDMALEAKGKMSLKAKEMELKTDQDLKIDAGKNCDVAAKMNGTLKTSSGSLEMKGGTTLKVEGTTQAELKGMMTKVSGQTMVQVDGQMIKLG